jgi:tetratricopeptide (TPR) repeat protein
VMNKFVYGGMNNPNVYLDENNLRMTTNFRINFARLAEELLNEGRHDSAVKVLDKCLYEMPDKVVPYNYFMSKIAELYYRAAGAQQIDSLSMGNTEVGNKAELIAKANAISQRIMDIYLDNMNYYLSLKGTKYYKLVDTEMNQALYILQSMSQILRQSNQKEMAEKAEKKFMEVAQKSGGGM